MWSSMQGCAFTSPTCSAEKQDCENSCTVHVLRAQSYLVAEDRSFSPTNWRMCPELATYVAIVKEASESSVRKLLASKVCIYPLHSPVSNSKQFSHHEACMQPEGLMKLFRQIHSKIISQDAVYSVMEHGTSHLGLLQT